MSIAWPWIFLLLPLPALIWWTFPAAKPHTSSALRVPFFQLINQIQGDYQQHTRTHWQRWLTIVIWCLIVLAASRPQWLGEPVAIPQDGRDIMLAVDISGSMDMEDMQYRGERINRLQMIKIIASEFIEKRENDRLGLILYGDAAYIQSPLSFDRKTVQRLMLESEIGMAGRATAIGDAIGLAIKRLRDPERKERVLILLTDGKNTAGSVTPIDAARLAADNHLKIYTIGVGSDKIIQQGFILSRSYSASADLDEPTLRQIADITGGLYFRARSTNELKQIYDAIDELEPTKGDDEVFRPVTELYMWPLACGWILSVFIALSLLWPHMLSRFEEHSKEAS